MGVLFVCGKERGKGGNILYGDVARAEISCSGLIPYCGMQATIHTRWLAHLLSVFCAFRFVYAVIIL